MDDIYYDNVLCIINHVLPTQLHHPFNGVCELKDYKSLLPLWQGNIQISMEHKFGKVAALLVH